MTSMVVVHEKLHNEFVSLPGVRSYFPYCMLKFFCEICLTLSIDNKFLRYQKILRVAISHIEIFLWRFPNYI